MSTDLTPESIQQTARAFSRSRVLLTAVELGIFTLLSGNFSTAEETASRLGADPRATTILLDALGAMDLLEKADGRYRTAPEAVALLSGETHESILPGLMHSVHLWKTWSQLTAVVLKGGPAREEDTSRSDHTVAFIGAMHVRALRDAPRIVESVDPGKAGNLIDVGGGSGSYTIAFLTAVPDMKATIFDLPEVIDLARARIADEGLTDRVTLVSGNYNQDAFPPGHDLAFLSAIIHQNSHEQNVALYRKVFDALDPGGRIVIRDYVMDPDRTRPASGALFAVNMLVNTSGGNSYTFEEIRKGLMEAGFDGVNLMQEKEMSSLVEAFKP